MGIITSVGGYNGWEGSSPWKHLCYLLGKILLIIKLEIKQIEKMRLIILLKRMSIMVMLVRCVLLSCLDRKSHLSLGGKEKVFRVGKRFLANRLSCGWIKNALVVLTY